VRAVVSRVQTAAQRAALDSMMSKRKADSIAAEAAKADTLTGAARARRDSIALVRRTDSVAAADRAKREAARLAARQRGGRAVPVDTTPPPKMNRPRVYNEAYITLDTALLPGRTYRLQMTGVSSLNNTLKSPARNFTLPRVKVDSSAKDSTRAKRDSTKPPGVR
jgi:hypothetical protein